MMPAQSHSTHLIDLLPKVRGRLSADASLAGVTWFSVGGPAEVLFRPADRQDLAAFLAAKPAEVPVTVLGVGSNLLVRDGGVPGVVIRLGRDFVRIEARGERLIAGAGALDINAALTARDHAIAGLEFLSGVPGTIGGALRMNAGAYGGEMSQVVVAAEAVDGTGTLHAVGAAELAFTYRHCGAPADWVFLSATLQGRRGDRGQIGARIVAIEAERQASQPRSKTGGSTFVNPPGAKAWELIDRAGCRGLRQGGAQVSEKHANFLINTGEATAHDIESLGEEVRRRVLADSGIALQWEILRIGMPAPGQRPIRPGVAP